jgi:hypothetical protein
MVGYQLQACPIVYQCQHMWSDQRTQWRVKKSLLGEQTHSGHLDNFSVFNYCIWEINSRGETAKSSELAKLSKLSSAGGGREEGGQRWHIQKCIESNVSILCLASHQATTERRQKCRVNSFGGACAVLITCNYMDPIKYQVWNPLWWWCQYENFQIVSLPLPPSLFLPPIVILHCPCYLPSISTMKSLQGCYD